LDSEAARRAAALRPLLSKYMLSAWQYENRPPLLKNLELDEWA
jgi:hypothetical protein